MNLTSPCIPWYFPKNDSSNLRICNPWEAQTFRNKMDAITNDQCNYCLPDFSKTLYHATVTVHPFEDVIFKIWVLAIFAILTARLLILQFGDN